MNDGATIREACKVDYLDFLRIVWNAPEPFIVGRHTRAITERITQAVHDYQSGRSSFLCVQVPFRHGKSDMVSRFLPPWFLGVARDKGPDVIMTGYGANMVEDFSRKARHVMESKRYGYVFPGMKLSKTKNTAHKWGVEGSGGVVTAMGLGGALTGAGGHLIILDDYCKSRAEAESPTYRDRTWEAFKDDLMTRRAPVSIVIVCATPWHVDDVSGRIKREIETNSRFPRFDFLKFPARSDDYPTGYLFPERFGKEWYEEQYATLGQYSSAGLLDCDPQVRGGNIFQIEKIKVHDSVAEFPDCRYLRFWDLASTIKERVSDDPDYTVGALVGVTKDGGVDHVWVRDLVRGQWNAPERNAKIIDTAETDGSHVRIGVESVGGYKDAFHEIAQMLMGRRAVVKVSVSGDKAVRAAPIEPVMEAGNFHLPNTRWASDLIEEFASFPSGRHDDIVDAVAGAYALIKKHPSVDINRAAIGI